MLNLIGAIVGMLAIAVNLVVFTQALAVSALRRLLLVAAAGAWVGLASGLGDSGALAFASGPVPLIGVLFMTPLLIMAVAAARLPKLRAALLAIPMSTLIALNSLRVLGVQFLFLAAAGRLSGPFPYFAGLGDVITGVLAVPLALAIARGRSPSAATIGRWNLFGTFDLLLAVGLGVTSAAGSPLQLIHAGVGSQAIQFAPFCLVPTVLVPFFLITHGIIAAQLRAPRSAVALTPAG